MNIDRIAIRSLSRLGSRGTFGITMLEIPAILPEMRVLTADLSTTSGLDRFAATYPHLFYNVGIAEQNMIGIASGLAKEGFIPFVSTFANFSTMRSYEQMRLSMGYMGLNIKVVGLASGMAMGFFGNTHYGIEDMALMRAMPGDMAILSPADCLEVYKTIHAVALLDRPAYIRLTGGANAPVVYKEDYDFTIGKSILLKEGMDVAIVATGSMVAGALKAADILEGKNIHASVYNFHTIKPLDLHTVEYIASHFNYVVTVEEHSIVGGFGGAIAEKIATGNKRPKQLFLGLPSRFGRAGEYDFLLDHYGLTGNKIAEKIEVFLQ